MLPEILKQGEENTKEYWEKRRRKEILELFENNVYGRTPVKLPQEQKVSVSGVQHLINEKIAAGRIKPVLFCQFLGIVCCMCCMFMV